MLLGVFNYDPSDEPCQVNHMNRWHEIFAFSDVRQGLWVLDPCLLEMVVENTLAITVPNTGAKHMHSELWLRFYR